jgi:branched-chain amino acid transport system substrate-binding protein
MPTYTGDGLQVPDLYNLVNPDDPASTWGIKLIAVKPPAEDSPFVVTFTEANPDAPLTYAPQAYDCTMMIALAAELAGSTSAASIRESFPDVIASDGEECSSYADCAKLIADGAEKIKYSGAAAADYTWQDNADLAGGLFSVLEYGEDGVATEITTLDVSS